MIQWYPGHMKKGRRVIRENLSLVDLILEVVDARIPCTGRNKDLAKIAGEKKRILILNKKDLAEEEVSLAWKKVYQKMPVLLCNAKKGEGKRELLSLVKKTLSREKALHPPRLMVIGIPNVGKSLLINLLLGQKKVTVEARPGVTRGKQWIKMEGGFQLLDTPGILSPQIHNEEEIFKLAVTAAIPLKELDEIEVALQLLESLKEKNLYLLQERFQIPSLPKESKEILSEMGRRRGYLLSKGRIDYQRAAVAILREFQEGGLGPLTLEEPWIKERRR